MTYLLSMISMRLSGRGFSESGSQRILHILYFSEINKYNFWRKSENWNMYLICVNKILIEMYMAYISLNICGIIRPIKINNKPWLNVFGFIDVMDPSLTRLEYTE